MGSPKSFDTSDGLFVTLVCVPKHHIEKRVFFWGYGYDICLFFRVYRYIVPWVNVPELHAPGRFVPHESLDCCGHGYLIRAHYIGPRVVEYNRHRFCWPWAVDFLIEKRTNVLQRPSVAERRDGLGVGGGGVRWLLGGSGRHRCVRKVRRRRPLFLVLLVLLYTDHFVFNKRWGFAQRLMPLGRSVWKPTMWDKTHPCS